ncbi:MAG: c-type cytochrome [Bacteroidetes bacterium]|nr:c-type cytochrome [Bacteroidota bacterium]
MWIVTSLVSVAMVLASVRGVGFASVTDPPEHLKMRPLADIKIIDRGRTVFRLSCAPCHGTGGKGDGPMAANMVRVPTDLTKGVFANRSTICGELPLDYDIYHTVTSGIHNTAMPSFSSLSPEDRLAILEFIRSIAPKFRDTFWYPIIPVDFDDQVPMDAESITRGKAVYIQAKCGSCHGPEGKGDSPAVGVPNTLGKVMVKSDLTNRSDYRFSTDVRDLYRIFSSELDARKLSPHERWDLSNYVWSLRTGDAAHPPRR